MKTEDIANPKNMDAVDRLIVETIRSNDKGKIENLLIKIHGASSKIVHEKAFLSVQSTAHLSKLLAYAELLRVSQLGLD